MLHAKPRHGRFEPSHHRCGLLQRYLAGSNQLAQLGDLRGQPMVIRVDADGIDAGTIAVAQQLRDAAPAAQTILFSDVAEATALVELTRIPLNGLLAWKDATPEIVEWSTGPTAAEVGVINLVSIAQALAGVASKLNIDGVPVLTSMEKTVMRGLPEGKCERAIAEDLGVGERTVHRIVAHLKRKLGTDNLVQLGVRAVQTHVLGSAGGAEPSA